MDAISASFEQLANITDEDKMSILMPAAQLLLTRQKEKIQSLFNQVTGALADSLTVEEKSDDNGAYARIYLKGKHPNSSTGKRKGVRRSNGNYSGTNAEIGYILEYGSPRIAATHWMETANEEAADEVIAVEQNAWNDLITKKGL
jgi:hypothetical protein